MGGHSRGEETQVTRRHPLYRLADRALLLGFAYLALLAFASEFDATEWKSLGMLLGELGAYEAIRSGWPKLAPRVGQWLDPFGETKRR